MNDTIPRPKNSLMMLLVLANALIKLQKVSIKMGHALLIALFTG